MAWRASLLVFLAGCGPVGLEPVPDAAVQLEVLPTSEVLFGMVSPAGVPVREEILVRAVGEEAVALEAAWLEGDEDSFELVYDPTPILVQPGTQVAVEVSFLPTGAGSFSARLNLDLGAGDAWVVQRRLVGSGCNDPRREGDCSGGRGGPPPEDTGD